jgi:uncharacterized damage-inducible protein DinB
MLAHIRELYDYNRWANRRVLDVTATLNEAEFTRDLGSSFPSVRDTWAHIAGAEWVWLSRWQGGSPSGLPEGVDHTTHEAIARRLAEIDGERRTFLGRLTEEALEEPISYRNFAGQALTYSLRRLLTHCVNHSTYHRGQITTMLRQLGRKPVSTDMTAFFAAQ